MKSMFLYSSAAIAASAQYLSTQAAMEYQRSALVADSHGHAQGKCEYCASTYQAAAHRNGCPNCGAPAREVSTSQDAIANMNAALKFMDSVNRKA